MLNEVKHMEEIFFLQNTCQNPLVFYLKISQCFNNFAVKIKINSKQSSSLVGKEFKSEVPSKFTKLNNSREELVLNCMNITCHLREKQLFSIFN